MIPDHPFRQDPDGLTGIDCLGCNLRQDHAVHKDPPLPDLPYAGTSGWSGSETSMERAVDADLDGTTTARQDTTLRHLGYCGVLGTTWKELAEGAGWHHGQASGVLSVLHKEGRIARLTERRSRCQVYVLPSNVNGRETAPHGRRRTADIVAAIEDACVAAEDGVLPGFAPMVSVSVLRAIMRGDDD